MASGRGCVEAHRVPSLGVPVGQAVPLSKRSKNGVSLLLGYSHDQRDLPLDSLFWKVPSDGDSSYSGWAPMKTGSYGRIPTAIGTMHDTKFDNIVYRKLMPQSVAPL